jgi:hypothetical protein
VTATTSEPVSTVTRPHIDQATHRPAICLASLAGATHRHSCREIGTALAELANTNTNPGGVITKAVDRADTLATRSPIATRPADSRTPVRLPIPPGDTRLPPAS